VGGTSNQPSATRRGFAPPFYTWACAARPRLARGPHDHAHGRVLGSVAALCLATGLALLLLDRGHGPGRRLRLHCRKPVFVSGEEGLYEFWPHALIHKWQRMASITSASRNFPIICFGLNTFLPMTHDSFLPQKGPHV